MKAHPSRATRRARRHGFTLIEVMVVVTILGLIAGGVAIAVINHFTRARLMTARTQATSMRHVVESWRMTRAAGDECPTADGLIAAGLLDEGSKLTDPWDSPYEITCDGERTRVRSFGPDKKKGNEDDIVVPQPRPETAS